MTENPYEAPESAVVKNSGHTHGKSSVTHRVSAIALITLSVLLVAVGIGQIFTTIAKINNIAGNATSFDMGAQSSAFVWIFLLFILVSWFIRFGLRLFSGKYITDGAPGFLIWSGHGYLAPVLIFIGLMLTQLTIDMVFGNNYYTQTSWPKISAFIVAALLCWFVGLQLDNAYKHQNTKKARSKFFFVPFKYSGVLIGVISIPFIL